MLLQVMGTAAAANRSKLQQVAAASCNKCSKQHCVEQATTSYSSMNQSRGSLA
jgi:hypothetical protein